MIRQCLLVATLFVSVAVTAACGTKHDDGRPAAKEADNTGVNQRDRAESAVTPIDQKENETDLRITQDVRKAVVDDGALSFDAKNVKIVTSGAVVTLRGPVKDLAEKNAIEAKAKQVAGVTRVDNQLEIAH
jgi:hyperosmotically inducible periplasmic protein